MVLNSYNNLLTSGSWSSKDPKDDPTLALFGMSQKIANDPKKSSDKSNSDPNKVDPDYIRDLLLWMLEYPKFVVVNKKIMESNIGGANNTVLVKANGSATIQKIMGSGPVHHQVVEEALSYKSRETATIILPPLSNSILAFWSSRTKVTPNPSCPSST